MAGINHSRLEKLTDKFVRDGTDHFDVDGNSLELETGLLLYALVRRIRPKVIMETGTWHGYSSAFMAAALADNYEAYPNIPHMPCGRLMTVDIEDRHPQPFWEYVGVMPYIAYDTGGSGKYNPPWYPFDILFMDASHYKEDMLAEFAHFSKHIIPGSWVILHDSCLESFSREACDEIAKKIAVDNKIPAGHLRFSNMRGLDVIQWRQV